MPRMRRVCTVEMCDSYVHGHGYCGKHYRRWCKGWDILAPTAFDERPAKIEGSVARLSLGVNAKHGYATVDKEFAWLDKYKWTMTTPGYPGTSINGQVMRMHNLIVGLHSSRGLVVDHVNRNKLDNRLSNLRVCTQAENLRNSDRWENAKYYYFDNSRNKWRADSKRLGFRGRQFDSELEVRDFVLSKRGPASYYRKGE